MNSMTSLSLFVSAVLAQSPVQSLTPDQAKPDPGTTKDDKAVVIVVPRPVFVPDGVRYVVTTSGVFLDLHGVRIPMPGGGASGCFGVVVKTVDLQKPVEEKEKRENGRSEDRKPE